MFKVIPFIVFLLSRQFWCTDNQILNNDDILKLYSTLKIYKRSNQSVKFDMFFFFFNNGQVGTYHFRFYKTIINYYINVLLLFICVTTYKNE